MKIFGFNLSRTESMIAWGVIAVLLFVFYRWAKAKSAKLKLDSSIDEALNEGIASGEVLSYDEMQFIGWANSLESAMAGSGTDESSIYNVMRKMQHTTDLLYLIKKFGHRDKKNLFGHKKGTWDLSQWLTDELDSEELDKVNKILIDKSIRYQF